MNKLPQNKRVQILHMLVEGSSMRSISRVVGVSINTVTKLLIQAGEAAAAYHDDNVRDVKSARVQCDEIWSFCYAKAKNVRTAKAAPDGAGDVWTWTAIDADTKLIISWLVGGRDAEYAQAFMKDVAERLANRVQLTTDGHWAYLEAVEEAFGGDVDFAQLVKMYGSPKSNSPEARYSSGDCIGTKKEKIEGRPDPKHVSTSYVERANLSMRMGMKRYARLSNAFSKKIENHYHALALYFLYYNFCRIHTTLKITPAMAAGVTDSLRDMDWIVELIDARATKPGPRGPYQTKNSK